VENNYLLPSEFGTDWDHFIREWCLNSNLGYSKSDVLRALSALKRLWPESLEMTVSGKPRGAHPVVCAVDYGKLLADCEHLQGFSSVLARLKKGERSAYPELVVASSLMTLGYSPVLEVLLNGRVLDCVCSVEAQPVYFEVVAPDRSEHSQNRQVQGRELSERIRNSISRCRVEVAILEQLGPGQIDNIVSAVQDASDQDWHEIDSYARICVTRFGQILRPTFDSEGTTIIFAGETETQGGSSGVIVRWEDEDERAKHIFNAEYHHFSPEVANVLVVDVCAVGGLKDWPRTMRKLLQPYQNRKVGAIVLFEQGVLGPPEAMRRRWIVLVNPHAHIPIPQVLMDGLWSLDESHHYGMPSPDRL